MPFLAELHAGPHLKNRWHTKLITLLTSKRFFFRFQTIEVVRNVMTMNACSYLKLLYFCSQWILDPQRKTNLISLNIKCISLTYNYFCFLDSLSSHTALHSLVLMKAINFSSWVPKVDHYNPDPCSFTVWRIAHWTQCCNKPVAKRNNTT